VIVSSIDYVVGNDGVMMGLIRGFYCDSLSC
jgi:hypothetical protein